MAINFFQTKCQRKTKEKVFGIYDAPPATLLFENPDNWNVWIDNSNAKEITHTAIDACLDIPNVEGKRCESMITYDDTLTFIELKDRNSGRWAGKARDQLIYRSESGFTPGRRTRTKNPITYKRHTAFIIINLYCGINCI